MSCHHIMQSTFISAGQQGSLQLQGSQNNACQVKGILEKKQNDHSLEAEKAYGEVSEVYWATRTLSIPCLTELISWLLA